jgi:hypothetical protein
MKLVVKKVGLYGALLIIVLLILIMCAVPPVSRDALTHHLIVPKLYILHGGVVELPDIVFSYYPQLLDLLYCIPLIFQNDILPKYFHFLFGLLTALVIFLYLKNRLEKSYGLLGAVLFLSLPVIIKLSTTVYVDLGLIFFSFASLVAVMKWAQNSYRTIYLIVAGIFCGLALSTKYNGLVTFFILSAMIPFVYLNGPGNHKNHQIQALYHAGVFVIVSLLVFSPWMIKNYVWTKNPVYPLYNSFFKSGSSGPDLEKKTAKEKKRSWNHFMSRKYVYKEAWWETALIPVRIFFQGQDDDPAYFDGRLNPLLFILPFFAFFRKKNADPDPYRLDKQLMLWFSGLYIIFVFFLTDMRIRWIGPAIPPLVVLSVFGFHNVWQRIRQKQWIKGVWIVGFIVLLGFNFGYLVQQFQKVAPISYLKKEVTRDEYIQKRRPEYAALQYANKNLAGEVKLLGLFLGNRRYYSDHDISFSNIGFKKTVTRSESGKEMSRNLKQKEFTHLVINYSAFNEWVYREFNPSEKKILKDFFGTFGQLLFQKDGHGLYSLIDEGPLN